MNITDPRQAIKDVLARLARPRVDFARADDFNTACLAAWQCVTVAERDAINGAIRATVVTLRTRAGELRAKGDAAGADSVAEAAEDIERALPRTESKDRSA